MVGVYNLLLLVYFKALRGSWIPKSIWVKDEIGCGKRDIVLETIEWTEINYHAKLMRDLPSLRLDMRMSTRNIDSRLSIYERIFNPDIMKPNRWCSPAIRSIFSLSLVIDNRELKLLPWCEWWIWWTNYGACPVSSHSYAEKKS